MNTKEKLVTSALKLFSVKGFENTSTTSICTDAGFSSGALFVHFKTKKNLLDYIYVDIKKKYFDEVFLNLNSTLDVRSKFREVMKRSFNFYFKNYDSYKFMNNFTNSIHISRITREQIEFEMKAFYVLYKNGVDKGIFIDEDIKFILTSIGGMFYSLVDHVKNNENVDINKCIILIEKIILK